MARERHIVNVKSSGSETLIDNYGVRELCASLVIIMQLSGLGEISFFMRVVSNLFRLMLIL